jgi:phage-related protein
MFPYNETFTIFAHPISNFMEKQFEVVFLEEAFEFLRCLDKKHYEKILFNIRKAQINRDPELFKKLKDDIWELRTLYQGFQYRLLAFWDKTDSQNTLVISTHGFVKKTSKVPENEIQKANQLMIQYFEDKQKIKNDKR